MPGQDKLIEYHLQKMEEELKNSRIAFDNGLYRPAVSAAYYAMFHCTRALLAKHNLTSKSHSGLISVFSQNFVKNGIIEVEIGKILTDAFNLRIESDYEDFFYLDYEEAKEIVENSALFVKRIMQII
jgi:uncharacterized protein (UPF0332 family)